MATLSLSRHADTRADAELFLSGKQLATKFHQLFDIRPASTKAALDKYENMIFFAQTISLISVVSASLLCKWCH